MRSLKKAMLLCMLVLCVSPLLSREVSAVGLEDKLSIVDGSVLTDEAYVEDTVTILTRGNYLSNGMTTLQDKGGRVVAISGKTDCHRVCDQVVCNLYIERLSGDGNWYTYKYWTCSATNAYTCAPTRTTSVAGGYWYRAVGGHSAIEGSTIESVSTKTNGIWIE